MARPWGPQASMGSSDFISTSWEPLGNFQERTAVIWLMASAVSLADVEDKVVGKSLGLEDRQTPTPALSSSFHMGFHGLVTKSQPVSSPLGQAEQSLR